MDENDKSNYNLRILITYGDIIRSMHIPDQSGPGFPTSYVVLFFMFNHLMWEVIIRFIDICEYIDHHCLNFLFIIYIQQ